MDVSYNKLFKLLIDKEMKKKSLLKCQKKITLMRKMYQWRNKCGTHTEMKC